MSARHQIYLAAGGAGVNKTLRQMIDSLGLSTNLKLCLDAGDGNSYDPAVQTAKWLDTSGGGYDFFRGASPGGGTAAPTFHGTANGRSINEYFSYDGADYFVYDSTNETWMTNLHHTNSTFTVMSWTCAVNKNSYEYLFCTATSADNAGIMTERYANQVTIYIRGSTPNRYHDGSYSREISDNFWAMATAVLDEPGNALVSDFNTNYVSGAGDYTSTDGNASRTAQIGRASASYYTSSGSRIAMMAVWDTALTQQNLLDLYTETQKRFRPSFGGHMFSDMSYSTSTTPSQWDFDISFGLHVALGDLIVAFWGRFSPTLGSCSATDNLGNTYSALSAGDASDTMSQRIFYTIVTNPGLLNNVRITATPDASNGCCVRISIFAGTFTALDANPSWVEDISSPYNAPASGTLATANELVLTTYMNAKTPGEMDAVSSPFTVNHNFLMSSTVGIGISSYVTSSTNSVTPQWTGTGTNHQLLTTASFR